MNSKRLLFLLITFCAALNIFDVISTGLLLNQGVREINPVMNFIMERLPVSNPYLKVTIAKLLVITVLISVFTTFLFLVESDAKLSDHIAVLNRSFLLVDGVFLVAMLFCNFPALLLL